MSMLCYLCVNVLYVDVGGVSYFYYDYEFLKNKLKKYICMKKVLISNKLYFSKSKSSLNYFVLFWNEGEVLFLN